MCTPLVPPPAMGKKDKAGKGDKGKKKSKKERKEKSHKRRRDDSDTDSSLSSSDSEGEQKRRSDKLVGAAVWELSRRMAVVAWVDAGICAHR